MAYDEHIRNSQDLAVNCAVITLSDTRAQKTDLSGQKIRALLEAAGHNPVHYNLIKDAPKLFGQLMLALLKRKDIDAIITNGGTGISSRDQTIDVAVKLIERPLLGFGELFRMLSWEQIGSGAMLSRAVAGVTKGKLIFCLPGSPKAVQLAMEKLILPELGHLVSELEK